MVLDMTGGERLFGEPPLMLASLLQALSALQFFVHLAASANLLAAVCLAPYARRKPVLIARGNEAEALAGLPVAALPLSAQQAETFSLWGLQTLGQVAALPEVDLIVRLGQSGKRLRLLARGEHPHLMRPEEPVFALEELVVFDQPLELLDSLLFVVGPMLDQLLIRAQNHALALASVTLKLGLEGGAEPGEQRPAHVRSIKPALPAVDRDALLKLLHLDLLAHPPAAGIVQVELQAEPGVRGKVQIGLFAPQLPESTRLDVTLARIEALVGEERVGKATLLDIYRPDSFRMERFVVAPEKLKEVPGPPRQALALRRCRPPKAVSVWQKTSGLHCFAYNGTRYTVHEMYGPWRRSGSWWTPEVWSHEEWDVCATAAGGETMLCLLAHDLLRHAWRLEGLYD
jgi:protein ImuB